MVSVLESYPQPLLLDALGQAALHSLWQGALLTLALWAFSGILRRRPRLWQAAHAGALALMVLLPLATALSLVARAPEPREHRLGAEETTAELAGAERAGAGVDGKAGVAPPAASAAASETQAPPSRLARIRTALAAAGTSWLGAVWLAGVFGLSLWWIGERTTGPGRTARPAPERCRRKIHRLSRRLRLRRPVEVTESGRVDLPTVVGFRRPLIVLPAGTRDNLSSRQIDAILAPHLAHLRLYDDLKSLLLRVIENLLFFHPAVWWISRRLHRERERRCGELAARVAGRKPTYAQALASLDALRGSQRLLRTAARGGSPEARVERLVCFSPHHPSHSVRAVAGALSIVVLACGAVGGAFLAPEDDATGAVLTVPEGFQVRIEGSGRLVVHTAERQVRFVDSFPVGSTRALATGEEGTAYLFHPSSSQHAGFWEAVMVPAGVTSTAVGEANIAGALSLEVKEATALELEFVAHGAMLRSRSALPTVAVGISSHPLREELARRLGLDPERASAVLAVGDGTPAWRSGMRRGDIITHIDDRPVGAGISAVLRGKHPGDDLTYRIWRKGVVRDVLVTLEARKIHELTLQSLEAPPLEAREILPDDSAGSPLSSLPPPARGAG